jgi:hypothetical protein
VYYINIYVRLVGIFDELSTSRHGTENFKISDVLRLAASYVDPVSTCILVAACRMNATRTALRTLQLSEARCDRLATSRGKLQTRIFED